MVRPGPGGSVESGQTGRVIRTCEAIVLKAVPFAEGGAVVSFLSEHGERLSGLAKGVKKPTAKWVAAFEPLGMVRVSFFGKEQTELKRVTRCELRFSPLTLGHLESSLVMACLADLFDRVAREGVEDDRLYRLLSACGRALKADPGNALGILAYAEHWLLHCLGLLPHPRVCGRCGNETAPLVLLSPEGGWCCASCTPADPRESLPPGSREHLRRLRVHGPEAAPRADSTDEAQRAITVLLRARLLQELGGELKSYDVLWRSV
jgi:DNA repair protein RecO